MWSTLPVWICDAEGPHNRPINSVWYNLAWYADENDIGSQGDQQVKLLLRKSVHPYLFISRQQYIQHNPSHSLNWHTSLSALRPWVLLYYKSTHVANWRWVKTWEWGALLCSETFSLWCSWGDKVLHQQKGRDCRRRVGVVSSVALISCRVFDN